MTQTRRSLLTSLLAAAVTLSITVGTALAAELMGTVKSVDIEAKKILITEKDTDKDIEVTVTEDTEWETPKKKMKGYDLAKLKKGSMLEVTHEDAKASKVVIKKGAGKKKKDN